VGDPKKDRRRALDQARADQRGALTERRAQVRKKDRAKRRRGKGLSPNKRTLDYCRARGWQAAVVESRIPHTFITRDLFGFIDIIAVDGRRGLIGIQATSDVGGNHSGARMEKIATDCRVAALAWLRAGLRLEVWAFRHSDRDGHTLLRIGAKLDQGSRGIPTIVWDDVCKPVAVDA
jgi:hypothetical protein